MSQGTQGYGVCVGIMSRGCGGQRPGFCLSTKVGGTTRTQGTVVFLEKDLPLVYGMYGGLLTGVRLTPFFSLFLSLSLLPFKTFIDGTLSIMSCGN